MFRTYVPWHPLAVTLAQLCTIKEGETVEQAWRIIDQIFESSGERVADAKDGMLWRPIKKLLKKAQAARASRILPPLQNMEISPMMNNYNISSTTIAEPQALLPWDTHATTDFTSESTSQIYTVDSETMLPWLVPLESTDSSLSWTDWNDFVVDTEQVNEPRRPEFHVFDFY
jgi:hypothetical protein